MHDICTLWIRLCKFPLPDVPLLQPSGDSDQQRKYRKRHEVSNQGNQLGEASAFLSTLESLGISGFQQKK